jgi:glucose dehydrogenase
MRPRRAVGFTVLILVLLTGGVAAAQERGVPFGEWHFLGGDAWHTRYSPLDQIDASNFENLEVAWLWRGDNFGPAPDNTSRSTPSYIDGVLYTVAGSRRTVVAMDPATGETLWTFREPHTTRWERSMRASYGKGVSYGAIDGRGVIYITTPAFFLWALDAKTGQPLENWGTPVPIEGFPETGVVDLLPDLLRDWGPWESWTGGPYDPDFGIPRELGMITSSSPPIIVDGVVVVGNSAEQGYLQTRVENVPGDILGYDMRTGRHLWKFHVIPRPGEFGHDTWENDAWAWTGDVSSWAPMSADLERGIVYIPTNPPTIDHFSGFRPGDNLFGTSLIALDARTGERVWHFQLVRNDLWNYDTPTAPILLDLTVDGVEVPAVVQTTKQGFAYTFNRVTGEPVWPIVDRPVPQSEVPGEWTSPTQPFPTRPAPYELQGLTEDDLIDFTPELRRRALETVANFRLGPLYNPPTHMGREDGILGGVSCPGGVGATNIFNPTSADPETNIMYVSTGRTCNAYRVGPGVERDAPDDIMTTGTTISQWVNAPAGGFTGPDGLPLFRPPYSRIVAIDMNTGEHLWSIPNGVVPDRIRNHPELQGVDLSNAGNLGRGITMVTGSLLLHAEGSAGEPLLHAVDKRTGERIGSVEIPAPGSYGMMSYMHEGRQYVIVQISGRGIPGSLVALRLP